MVYLSGLTFDMKIHCGSRYQGRYDKRSYNGHKDLNYDVISHKHNK